MMNGFYVTENGRVSIAPNIVRSFVTKEVESCPYFRFSPSRGEGFGEYFGKRSIDNSVRITFADGRAEIALLLQVRFGTRIRLQARELQGRIIRALALGTGLEVQDIKITVDRVYYEPEGAPAVPGLLAQPQDIELDEA
jgi:uncharacterized alkaline shock family protein YloU